MQPLLQWKSNTYYIFWVCVCSLRYPARKIKLRHTVICGLVCSSISYYKWHKKKVIEHKMCILSSSTTFARNISHSKSNWARYDKKMYIALHMKYPLFLFGFNETWIFFFDRFSKNVQISNLMEIRPVRAEFFHADRGTEGQTDRHKESNSHFSQFCESTYKRLLPTYLKE